MDYLTENVAVNLKRIRQSKGMSLDQASEQTGVSKSMLSQIEKGTANPLLGVLGKITSGLRIEFQELIATPLVDSYLVTPEDLVPAKEVEGSTLCGRAFRMRTRGLWKSTASTSNRAECM